MIQQKKLTPKEILDIINEIEKNYPVCSWKFKEIDLWPIIRINLGNYLNPNLTSAKPKKRIDKILDFYFIFKQLFQDRNQTTRKIAKSDIFFLTGSANRTILNNNTIAKEVDPIVNELSRSNIKSFIFEIQNKPHLTLKRANSTYLSGFSILLNSVFSKIYYFFSNNDLNLNQFEELKLDLYKKYKFSPPILEKEILIKKTLNIYILALYFEKLLKKIQPKICAAPVFYNYESLALCFASKKIDIPFMDLQHGIAGKSHRNYDNWIISGTKSFNTLPDMFWSWSEFDASTIESWGKNINPKIETILGGNPYIFEALKNISPIPEMNKDNQTQINILISLQKDYISDMFIDLILNSPHNYHFYLREHPINKIKNRAEIEARFNQNSISYDFQISNSSSLFSLLQYMNIHLTEHSAVVFDCVTFNIKSIFINPEGRDYFENLILQNKCFYANNKEEIKELINIHSSKPSILHSKENFKNAIDYLVKKIN